MPFTMDGQWIPSDKPLEPKKPVRIRLEKKKNTVVTVICNLNMSPSEMLELASTLKKKLGCGGSVKDDEVLVQGDKVSSVRDYLSTLGIKVKI